VGLDRRKEFSLMNATVMKLGNMPLDASQAFKVIHSVGWDAGNAHAAKHGRSVWSVDDYNAAARFSNRLYVKFGLAPAPRAKKIRVRS
jgi:hypothetical protein